jgi:hypothetical protein
MRTQEFQGLHRLRSPQGTILTFNTNFESLYMVFHGKRGDAVRPKFVEILLTAYL